MSAAGSGQGQGLTQEAGFGVPLRSDPARAHLASLLLSQRTLGAMEGVGGGISFCLDRLKPLNSRRTRTGMLLLRSPQGACASHEQAPLSPTRAPGAGTQPRVKRAYVSCAEPAFKPQGQRGTSTAGQRPRLCVNILPPWGTLRKQCPSASVSTEL